MMDDTTIVDTSSSESGHDVPPLTPSEESKGAAATESPLELKDDDFQNESNQHMLEQQEMPMNNTIEDEQYYDDCNIQKEEENRVTASTAVESVWDEQDGNSNRTNEESKRSDDDGDSDDDNRSHATSSSRLGSCSYCLRRLVVQVCRPHIQSPCCFSSPRLPKCLQRISPRKRQIICRSLIILFMIITITFVCLDLIFMKRYLHSWLRAILEFMEENPGWGGLSFVGIFVIASLCFFPVPLLSLGAGFVYIELYGLGIGICVSFLVCYIGYLCGAAICFARSRYLMRRLIVRFSEKYPVVRAVDRAFETMGFRIFLLLRLSPAMPFNALNYIGGITAIKFKSYFLSTSVGVIPGLIWTIFVGATFGTVGSKGVDGNQQLDEKSAVNKGVVLGLGIGLGVMGLIGTGIYARRELTKIIIAEQQSREAEEQAALRFSNSSLEEGAENPQSGYDEDSVSLATIEESASIARSRKGSFHSTDELSAHISPSLSLDAELSPNLTAPARRRNWTADNIAAELPIVPVVSPYFWKMMSSSETPRDDQGVDLRRTGSTEAISPPNRTQGLGEIDESRALSFRNQQGQDGFLQGSDYKPVSNRRRCGTDPYAHASSQKQFDVPSNVIVEEKKGEDPPKKGLMKLFQGLSVPSTNDFPRFNRPRCNSDPNEAEKRAAAIDAVGLDVEAGVDSFRSSSSPPLVSRDLPHPLHVEGDAVERPIHRRMRSASMNQLGLEEEGLDREWFWLFA
mmetsp:Transcript_21827/g.43721  ORF Transcript_21827/g.43721 Transcript_21827/m.43721 type:complete len:740 (-) Transcript_21827:34-2253(-)